VFAFLGELADIFTDAILQTHSGKSGRGCPGLGDFGGTPRDASSPVRPRSQANFQTSLSTNIQIYDPAYQTNPHTSSL